MMLEHMIIFPCGCLGFDVQRGDQEYLILQTCNPVSLGLSWRYMADANHSPAKKTWAFDAINELIRQAQEGRKLDSIRELLKAPVSKEPQQ